MTAACGFESRCGRPAAHRGHHGGWRTGVTLTAPRPTIREGFRAIGSELTPRDLLIVAELLRHGRHKDVAACLGISVQTSKNHASSVMQRTGAATPEQVAWLLGWVTLPDGLHCPAEAA